MEFSVLHKESVLRIEMQTGKSHRMFTQACINNTLKYLRSSYMRRAFDLNNDNCYIICSTLMFQP